MSQFFLPPNGSPTVPTTFQTDSGNATPLANTIIFHGVGGSFSGSGNTVTFTVSSTGLTWNDFSSSGIVAKNNGYFIASANLTATLPTSPSQGDTIEFIVDTSLTAGQNFVIQANTGQKIRIGSNISSTSGTTTTTAQGNTVELIYRAASSTWIAGDNNGSWTLA